MPSDGVLSSPWAAPLFLSSHLEVALELRSGNHGVTGRLGWPYAGDQQPASTENKPRQAPQENRRGTGPAAGNWVRSWFPVQRSQKSVCVSQVRGRCCLSAAHLLRRVSQLCLQPASSRSPDVVSPTSPTRSSGFSPAQDLSYLDHASRSSVRQRPQLLLFTERPSWVFAPEMDMLGLPGGRWAGRPTPLFTVLSSPAPISVGRQDAGKPLLPVCLLILQVLNLRAETRG